MSVTFSPCITNDASLVAHQARWDALLSDIGADKLSAQDFWDHPAIQGYTEWPTVDAEILHQWNSLSEDEQDDLSLNVNNTNCVKLMTALGYELSRDAEGYVTDIGGRDSVAELRLRVTVAQVHVTDPYLVTRLDQLRYVCDRAAAYGFKHLSWS